ncbi:hypothetical protein M422DRAFT_254338 [Sphaerobolus stellatus SS14]|uniref:Unplaced genomic scaffold SPHSTscaffold_54, whole genome shotgun sequence n=1 Tax=Sphaerobolus stellatus (strain SS14) TaxID=990650 RepID=A0A0C9UHK4_SPHS4|nr:hypothetical protein M422DRAFT_254338 [Sphaerobolus stellatus SS14]
MSLQDPKHPANAQVIYARSYGALMIAILISTFMYGVSLLIVLQYFKLQAKRDTSVLKVTISTLITLGTLETIFTGHQLYDTFIINTGNTALMDQIPLQVTLFLVSRLHHDFFSVFSSMSGEYACTYLTAFVAQLFFASRIWSGQLFSSQQESSQSSTAYGRSGYFTGFTPNGICALLGAFLYYFVSYTDYFLIPLLVNAHLYVISAVSILTLREGLREEINQSFHLSDLYTNTSRSDVTNGRQNVRSEFT